MKYTATRWVTKRIGAVVLTAALVFLSACGGGGQLELEGVLKENAVGDAPGAEEAPGKEQSPAGQEGSVCVHICGEVMRPGVYELDEGSRVCDALQAAGGFTEDADETYVNLALRLCDGMQVVIPSVEEAALLKRSQEQKGQEVVDINRAGAEELCTLPGIGESRAGAIIAYREEHGGFATKEEIMQVPGIGRAMYDRFKDRICAGE